jgi:hypothetical protein
MGKYFIIFVLIFTVGINQSSAHGRAWIIVSSVDSKFKLIPGKLPEGSSLLKKEKGKYIKEGEGSALYFFSHNIKKGEWTTLTYSFTPQDNGYISLAVGGDRYQIKTKRLIFPVGAIFYDDIKLQGAVIRNGGFEGFGHRGKISDWKLKRNYSKIVSKPGFSHSGNSCLKTWNCVGAHQAFAVRKGEQIEISLKVKNGFIIDSIKNKWTQLQDNIEASIKTNETLNTKDQQIKNDIKFFAVTVNQFLGILKATTKIESQLLDIDSISLKKTEQKLVEINNGLEKLKKKEYDVQKSSFLLNNYVIISPNDYAILAKEIDKLIDFSGKLKNNLILQFIFDENNL